MSTFNIVATSNESTVVTEYIPEEKKSTSFQSEQALENEFIRMLIEQGYERLYINSEAELVENLRKQLEILNDYTFTDSEWKNFFSTYIANANEGIVEKTRTIQEDSTKVLVRDDGSSKNIRLIDKKNIHNNRLQVLNQYVVTKEDDGAKYDNRYDVTILVNGLPLVHTELKRRGVAIREAFNQIERYQRDSFWSGYALFEYVQIFIISNGTHTKYYSNTTRKSHLDEMSGDKKKNSRKTSNSFEFTSFWADANNKIIADLIDFTKTFLSKHTILNILTRFCVFTTENILLVMRPYQIAATERILNRIEIATNYKQYGTLDGGGYIWHTTGSGKTLTSFKTAQLASRMDGIDKVLFVVDRKDLDYQTMKEYDRFEKNSANSNSSTAILQKQLEDANAKIIITTIQKLDCFVKKNKDHDVYGKHIVIIFDECHRSQFGDMHKEIVKKFKKYHIFGFTGTPIFAENAGGSKNPDLTTTPQAFGTKLHTYTIVDAINDNNVLPFRIDYIKTIKEKEEAIDKEVSAIDREKALQDPKRIEEITKYILEHFTQKTKRNREAFNFSVLTNVEEVAKAKDRRLVEEKKSKVHMTGFNSIFAVGSIDFAKLYYNEFKRQQKDIPEAKRLKIATIYSYGVNEDVIDDFVEDENNEDTLGLDAPSRDFLEMCIQDYNMMFHTNYDTSADKFQNYYKDLSLRMKNREVDLLIVVNMFLTGFDATTLNTLWVDKNLKYHGLIQAFSRTNRILNSVKTFGNVVCFRNLEKETNDAITLFGNKDAESIILLRKFNDYYKGYDEDGKHHAGYEELIDELKAKYPSGEPIIGEEAQKEFIKLFGKILRARNILTTFDDFEGNDLVDDRTLQDYQSVYIDLYQELKKKKPTGEKEVINDDVVFEIELIKQVEVNIDFILQLVKQYQKDFDKEIVISIDKAMNSSFQLRSKLKLIHLFIENINPETNVDYEWRGFLDSQRKENLDIIIEEEKMKREETYDFMSNAFRNGVLKTDGKDFNSILKPTSRFGNSNFDEMKNRVISRLQVYYEMFIDMFYGDDTLNK